MEFRAINCEFQHQLKKDTKVKIKKGNSMLMKADKTSNYYRISTDRHNKLLNENITQKYRKTNSEDVDMINKEPKMITTRLGIDDRVEQLAQRNAFITLKDHKQNFMNKPSCRLINPAKSELGIVSKEILDRINSKIISSTQINHWKNTYSVLKWFDGLENKIIVKLCKF